MSGRVHKSMLNAEVNLLFYFLSLFLAFFSRRIFLDCLGTEFIGLTGTLGNILGYLNLAELGIVSCISFFLFKPLQTNNRQEIQDILSLLGYLYNWIGGIILCCGILVSLFFPLIFAKAELDLSIIYFAFYSFLGSSLIGYFINYRQILLSADQKRYLVAIYLQSANLIKTVIQIALAYTYKNLYLWVGIEFLFAIFGCIVLNWRINKEYPWLKVNKKNGKALLKKYPEIISKTKQVFIHKIKDFVLVKSDELFIFVFVSLKMVAFYGNYMMIISRLISLFSAMSGGVGASIGNLVAEGDKKKMIKVFWEYTTIQHTISAILCFSLYSFLEPFVAHWLGPEYIMDNKILILLIVFTLPLTELTIGNTLDVSDTLNAKSDLSKISQAIEEVYGQGQGSKQTVHAVLSNDLKVNVANNYISCNLKLNGGQIKSEKIYFKSTLEKSDIYLRKGENSIIVEWPENTENMQIYVE